MQTFSEEKFAVGGRFKNCLASASRDEIVQLTPNNIRPYSGGTFKNPPAFDALGNFPSLYRVFKFRDRAGNLLECLVWNRLSDEEALKEIEENDLQERILAAMMSQ